MKALEKAGLTRGQVAALLGSGRISLKGQGPSTREEKVKELLRLREGGVSVEEAARRVGIPRSAAFREVERAVISGLASPGNAASIRRSLK